MGDNTDMRHLIHMTKKRLMPIMGASVLLTGGIGASLVFVGGTADATACAGTPVLAGTACTDIGTLTMTAGSLGLTVPTALGWSETVNGLDRLLVDPTTVDQTYQVNDATGSAVGWHVTVSATTFTSTSPAATLGNTGTFATNGSLTLTTGALSTAAPTAACTSGSTCTVGTNNLSASYPVAITTAALTPTAATIYDAPAGSGLGTLTIGSPGADPVGWWISVPSNTLQGTYTSTVTLELLSTP
jgi:hypothetical protein